MVKTKEHFGLKFCADFYHQATALSSAAKFKFLSTTALEKEDNRSTNIRR
jgi:hypothetical protein